MGTGLATTRFGEDSWTWGDLFKDQSSSRYAFDFEVGLTLNPQLLLGLRASILTEAADGFTPDRLRHDSYLASVTYFPRDNGEGVFLRAGAGLSRINYDLEGNNAAELVLSGSTSGVGATVGLGYAFWIASSFNIALSNDIHYASFDGKQESGEATSGWFDALQLGLYWY